MDNEHKRNLIRRAKDQVWNVTFKLHILGTGPIAAVNKIITQLTSSLPAKYVAEAAYGPSAPRIIGPYPAHKTLIS